MKRLLLLCATLLVTLAAIAQQHPNEDRGFAADRVFNYGSLDHINTFNGNRVVTIPLGGTYPVGGNLSYAITLVYSGNPWDYDSLDFDKTYPCVWSFPNRRANAGFGWMVTLGRLIPPTNRTNESERWIYESSDGADHQFYNSLTGGTADPNGYQYTRDSSYIRLHPQQFVAIGGMSVAQRKVETPDGLIRTFRQGSDAHDFWRLMSIEDRSGNAVSISYSAPTTSTEVWTIGDSHGRQHKLYFRHRATLQQTLLEKVELAAAHGQIATYTLQHVDTETRWGPKDTCGVLIDGHTRTTTTVAFLTRIDMPEGLSYDMTKDGVLTYSTDGTTSGNLLALRLPTRGWIEWDFGTYQFPDGSARERSLDREERRTAPRVPRTSSTGVAERRLTDASGNVLARWTYQQRLGVKETCVDSNQQPLDTKPRDSVTIVTMPDGETTSLHYYNVYTLQACAPDWLETEYGDSGTRYVTATVGGETVYLATELRRIPTGTTIPSRVNGRVAVGTLLRSEFVYTEHEAVAPDGGSGALFNTNARVRRRKTTFNNDTSCGGAVCAQDVLLSGFDGFGNFRQTSTGSNFATDDFATSFTNYSAPSSSAWIAGMYTEQCSSIDSSLTTAAYSSCSALTQRKAHTESCFDESTGLLKGRRVRKDPLSAGGHDVMTLFTYSSGNLQQEKWFGGDSNVVPGTGLCNAATSDAQYQIEHTYVKGSLASSKYAGTAVKHVDRTIDPNTGATVTARDTAGVATTITYDKLGRMTETSTTGGTKVTYAWTAPTETAGAKVAITEMDGLVSLTAAEVLYDSLGRVAQEKRRVESTPAEVWNVRVTEYDGFSRKAKVSEPALTASNYTTFAYDEFGRVKSTVRPDGTSTIWNFTDGYHDVTRVTKNDDGVAVLTASETYDGQGRLRSVREADTGADYAYDVAGRLTSAKVLKETTPSVVTQDRTFTYDGRGFLTAEDHPESDPVTYEYDARGHVTQKSMTDCFADLRYTYDSSERLRRVDFHDYYKECSDETRWRALKTFEYGENNGYVGADVDLKSGKLTSQSRYNAFPDFGTIVVTDTFAYTDTAGRLTQKSTNVEKIESGSTSTMQTFVQKYQYDKRGERTRIDYPQCELACGQPTWGWLGFKRTDGLLKSVDGFATIAYNPNGALKSISHSNNVNDLIGADPHGMARPSSYTFGSTSGGDNGWDDCGSIALNEPADRAVYPGQSVTLTVGAVESQNAPLSYQWYKEGVAIEGATTAMYSTGALQATTTYRVHVYSACRLVKSRAVTVTVTLDSPQGIQATASSVTTVNVSWYPVQYATKYVLYRKTGTQDFSAIYTGSSTSYTDYPESGMTHIYRVVAESAQARSEPSRIDIATTMDMPNPSGVISAADFDRVLQIINAVRGASGAPPLTWTQILPANVPPMQSGAVVHSQHVISLRIYMDDALGALGVPAGGYADTSLSGIRIRAYHLNDIQVRAR